MSVTFYVFNNSEELKQHLDTRCAEGETIDRRIKDGIFIPCEKQLSYNEFCEYIADIATKDVLEHLSELCRAQLMQLYSEILVAVQTKNDFDHETSIIFLEHHL